MSIFASNLAARWLVKESAVLDAVVRLVVFGVLTIGLGSVVGSYLGPSIRANALWFWLVFFVGFVGTPFVLALLNRRHGQGAG
jgi:hypothetical protein